MVDRESELAAQTVYNPLKAMSRELRILLSWPGLPELIACDPHGL